VNDTMLGSEDMQVQQNGGVMLTDRKTGSLYCRLEEGAMWCVDTGTLTRHSVLEIVIDSGRKKPFFKNRKSEKSA
jgi:hypothetical protein